MEKLVKINKTSDTNSVNENGFKCFEETKRGQILAYTLLVYMLSAFTHAFQMGFKMTGLQEQNPLLGMINVHQVFYAKAGMIDSICYTLGRLTAWVLM